MARLDFEVFSHLVVVAFAVILNAPGKLDGPFYPVVYALMMLTAAFARPSAAVATVAFTVLLEAGIQMLGYRPRRRAELASRGPHRPVRVHEHGRLPRRDRAGATALQDAHRQRDRAHEGSGALLPAARGAQLRAGPHLHPAARRRGAAAALERGGDPPGAVLRAGSAEALVWGCARPCSCGSTPASRSSTSRSCPRRTTPSRRGRSPRATASSRRRCSRGETVSVTGPKIGHHTPYYGALAGRWRRVRGADPGKRPCPRRAGRGSRRARSVHQHRRRADHRGDALRAPRDRERARVRSAGARQDRAGQAVPRGRLAGRGQHRGVRGGGRREQRAGVRHLRLRRRHAVRSPAPASTRSAP